MVDRLGEAVFLPNADAGAFCNFCCRRETAVVIIGSTSPDRTLRVRLCQHCSEKLKEALEK